MKNNAINSLANRLIFKAKIFYYLFLLSIGSPTLVFFFKGGALWYFSSVFLIILVGVIFFGIDKKRGYILQISAEPDFVYWFQSLSNAGKEKGIFLAHCRDGHVVRLILKKSDAENLVNELKSENLEVRTGSEFQ